MNECQNCGAPGGAPICSPACKAAMPGPDVPIYDPSTYTPLPDTDDPWATDAQLQ